MIKIKYLKKFFRIYIFFSGLIITSHVSADLMSGMGGMFGMGGMTGMSGMEGMVAMYGMDAMTGMRSVSYGFIAGSILGSRGWYERRESGQLILYPTTNLYNGMYGVNTSTMGMDYSGNMNGMTGMSGMTSMLGSMSPMGSISSVAMVSNTGKISGSSQGWYWITPTGQLILTPVYNIYGSMETTEEINDNDLNKTFDSKKSQESTKDDIKSQIK